MLQPEDLDSYPCRQLARRVRQIFGVRSGPAKPSIGGIPTFLLCIAWHGLAEAIPICNVALDSFEAVHFQGLCLFLCVLVKLAQAPTELIEPACPKFDHIKVLVLLAYSTAASAKKTRAAAQGLAIRVGLSKADVQERRALCASARTTNIVTSSLDIAAKPHESAHGLRGPRIRCCSAVMIIHDWTVSEMRHLVPWKMTHPRR